MGSLGMDVPGDGQTGVVTGTVARLMLVSVAEEVASGTCAVLNVKAVNADGTPIQSNSTISFSGKGDGEFYSDAGCSQSIASYTFSPGALTANLYFRTPTSGEWKLGISAEGMESGTAMIKVKPAEANKMAFAEAPPAFTAGTCQTFHLQSQDKYGNASVVKNAVAVSLSEEGAGAFFTDKDCQVSGSSVTLAAGTSETLVYFADNVIEKPTLTASSTNLGVAKVSANVTLGGPKKIAVVGPATAVAGECLNVKLQARDLGGNATAVNAETVLDLDAMGGGAFYNKNCTTGAITTAVLAAGTAEVEVGFRYTAVGKVTLSASFPGLETISLQPTIVAATTLKISFGGPTTFQVKKCSQAVRLQAYDAFGNESQLGAALTYSLASPGGGLFYSDANCLVPTTSTTVTTDGVSAPFYFKDNVVHLTTLKATPPTSPANNFAVTELPTEVKAGTPTKLKLVIDNRTPQADACTKLTVSMLDDSGTEALSAKVQTVRFQDLGLGGHVYADNDQCAGTPITTVDIAIGASSREVWYGNHKAEVGIVLYAGADGLTRGLSESVTVLAAELKKLAFVGGAINSPPGECAAVVVQSQDIYGNPTVVNPALTLNVSAPATSLSIFPASNCTGTGNPAIPGGTSQTTFSLKSPVAQTFTLNAASGNLTSASLGFSIFAGVATKLDLKGAQPTVNSCSPYTISTTDANGNLAALTSAKTILIGSSLTVAPLSFKFYAGAVCDGTAITSLAMAAGDKQAVFSFKDTAGESMTITVSDSVTPGLAAASLGLTVSGTNGLKLAFTAGKASIQAGACEPYTVTQRNNATGNAVNVTGSDLPIALSTDAATGQFFSDVACQTVLASPRIVVGQSNLQFYYRDTTIKLRVTLTAQAAQELSDNKAIEITAGVPAQAVLLNPVTSFTAGVCQRYEVKLKDLTGNDAQATADLPIALAFGAAKFYRDDACATEFTIAAPFKVAKDATGGVFFLQDKLAEKGNLTLASALAAYGLAIETKAGTAIKLAISGDATMTAGACSAAYFVTAADANGNATQATSEIHVLLALTIPAPNDGEALFQNADCSTPLTGNAFTISTGSTGRALWVKSGRAKALTVGATSSDLINGALLASATRSITVLPSIATRIVWSVPAPPATTFSIVAAECNPWLLETQDSFGTATPTRANDAVTLLPMNGDFYTAADCNPAAKINPGANGALLANFAGGATQLPLFYRGTKVSSRNTVAVTAVPLPAPSSLTVSVTVGTFAKLLIKPPTIGLPAKAAVNATYTIQALDGADNLTTVKNIVATISLAGLPDGYPATAPKIAIGYSSTTFIIAPTKMGTYPMTATAYSGQAVSNTMTVVITPNVIEHLEITGPANIVENTCATYTAKAVDSYGNPTNSTFSALASLTLANVAALGAAVPTTLTFFSDGACALQLTGKVLPWQTDNTSFTFSLKSSPSVFTLGRLSHPTGALQIGVSPDFRQLSAGASHTCGITKTDEVWCWGENLKGQLGDNSLVMEKAPALALFTGTKKLKTGAILSVGDDHACVADTNRILCWGKNDRNQIGLNSASYPYYALPYEFTAPNMPATPVVTAIASGKQHSCAIINNEVYCWGDNVYGQLGSPSANTFKPTKVVGIPSGLSATALVAGGYHTCAIMSGSLYCWGKNDKGQIGRALTVPSTSIPTVVPNLPNVTRTVAGDNHTCAQTGGALMCFGDNSTGQLGNENAGALSATPVAVYTDNSAETLKANVDLLSAGAGHTCAALTNDALWCWGSNASYEAGGDHTVVRPTRLETGAITNVATGGTHSCYLKGALGYCWGDNQIATNATGTTSDVGGLGVNSSESRESIRTLPIQ